MATLSMTTATRHGIDHGRNGTSSLATWFAQLYPSLTNWLAYRHQFRATRDELDALSDRELDDIGVVRCDIPKIAMESAEHIRTGG